LADNSPRSSTWCVCVCVCLIACDLETFKKKKWPRPDLGCSTKKSQIAK